MRGAAALQPTAAHDCFWYMSATVVNHRIDVCSIPGLLSGHKRNPRRRTRHQYLVSEANVGDVEDADEVVDMDNMDMDAIVDVVNQARVWHG